MGGPGRAVFDAVAWFDTHDHRRRGQRRGRRSCAAAATGVRKLQTGYVRNYALGVAVGAIVLVGVLLHEGWSVLMLVADAIVSTRRSTIRVLAADIGRPLLRVSSAAVVRRADRRARRPELARLVAAAVRRSAPAR